MNELCVTAVGNQGTVTSDTMVYTLHCDGPHWFLPGAFVPRVLVGLTVNRQVRTHFSLHPSCTRTLNIGDVLGFDYNRELHWIDNAPNTENAERRTLLKLHEIVYPRGWVSDSAWAFCAELNRRYNSWARLVFLTTLRARHHSMNSDLARAVVFATSLNTALKQEVGWWNIVLCLSDGPSSFKLLPALGVIHFSPTVPDPLVAHGQRNS